MDLNAILNPETLVTFFTLSFMEIILGIDNLLFLSIVSGKLPKQQQGKARKIGLALALVMRTALLLTIQFIVGLIHPIFEIAGHGVSWRDIILLLGGLFLLYKSGVEIYEKVWGDDEHDPTANIKTRDSFGAVIVQIVVLDLVFSIDSILTAVGLSNQIFIMIAAIVVAMMVMLLLMDTVSLLIQKYPSLKILALAFLAFIGIILILESVHIEIPKGYIYFSLFFCLAVELLNIQRHRQSHIRAAKNKKTEYMG